jgi:DNA primase
MFQVIRLKNSTVVLNSLSFLNEALPILSKFDTVNAFLDNDKAGKRALERLEQECMNVRDCSDYYPNNKDFNEYLMHSH